LAQLLDLCEETKGVLNLASINDILQICAEHQTPEATEWDHVISSMTSLAKWAPVGMFSRTVRACTCDVMNKATRVQSIVFLGMSGYLCVAKEITPINKSYVKKRWTSYCVGAKIVSLLSESKTDDLLNIIMSNQSKLYQTELGKQFAE